MVYSQSQSYTFSPGSPAASPLIHAQDGLFILS